MQQQQEKKHLSAKGLLALVKRNIQQISEPPKKRQGCTSQISIQDCLLSGLAIFGLKYSSLLQFDNEKCDEGISHNLKTLYGVSRAPSDTYLRTRLDEVAPTELRKSYKAIFSALQRGKVLEEYTFHKGHYLLALDGTEFFCSHKVHCDNCCARKHRGGSQTYYHQLLSGVLVHPNHKEVFPFYPEPIVNEDGWQKNDCETNATKRFLKEFRREHPHLPIIVVQDALSANAVNIKSLRDLNMSYIISVKPKGNKILFSWIKGLHMNKHKLKCGNSDYRFSFINGVPINDSHPDIKVNFLECWETTEKGQERHFSWVTDIEITKDNVFELSRGARARWRIENETFNTLKNQGYQFEHNFGHGNKNLSNVFAILMMLAFLIDQVQQRSCMLFGAALQKRVNKKGLWECMRSFFRLCNIQCWSDLFYAIANGISGFRLVPDTS